MSDIEAITVDRYHVVLRYTLESFEEHQVAAFEEALEWEEFDKFLRDMKFNSYRCGPVLSNISFRFVPITLCREF